METEKERNMNRQQILTWGSAILVVISLLSGCGGASPTPIVVVPVPPSTQVPALPPAVLPRVTATAIPFTATAGPAGTESTSATEGEGTVSPQPSATLEQPIDRPFLMRIDRISLIVGRGTLLEGPVANGT